MQNYSETERFLKAVFPDHQARAIYGSSTYPKGMRHVRDFRALEGDRDCYWSIAAFPDDGVAERTLARALSVGALVIDDVGTKVPSSAVVSLGPPTAVVETSPGNYQWTYRLATAVAVGEWTAFFGIVERLLGVDLDGCDAVHLFRLPMGVNTKPGKGLFMPRLIAARPGHVLDPEKIFGASGVGITTGMTGGPSGPGSGPEPRVHGIRKLVALIPNDISVSRDEWVRRAHQIKALAVDEAEGAKAFADWSRKWPGGYNGGETRRVWESITVSSTSGLGLLADAEAADPEGFARVMNAEAGAVFDDGEEAPAGRARPTHQGMADDIVALEHERLAWLRGRKGDWAMYDDVMRRWVIHNDEAALHRVVRDAIDRQLMMTTDPKMAANLQRAGWQHSVASLLRTSDKLAIEPGYFNHNRDMLGLPGKVLEMDASGLGLTERAGVPGDLITKATSVGVAPAGARGKYWEKFLADFTGGDIQLRQWWQAFMGYCLTGHTSEHIVVFVYGPGGNGKSVFLDIIAEVMGDYHARADHRLFMEVKGGKHLAPLAVLEGARLVTVPDVSVGATWDMGLVKQCSGGGSVTANRMRQDPITYIPNFKIVMAGNEKPRMDTVDDGVRRRIRLVPATFRPKAVDVGLVDKLRGEKAEILRWMVDGWTAWAAGGLPACQKIDDATDDYLSAADVFGRWAEECLKPTASPSTRDRVRIGDAFKAWEAFKGAEGNYGVAPTTTQQMSEKLKDHGFIVKRDMHGAYIMGVDLVDMGPKGVF